MFGELESFVAMVHDEPLRQVLLQMELELIW
jgi:hypothetical protein